MNRLKKALAFGAVPHMSRVWRVGRGCACVRVRRVVEPAVPGIASSNDLVDKTAIGGKFAELTRTTQQQLVLDRLLQMSMRTLNRAVLVRNTGVVAGWRHAVVRAQVLVALREVLFRHPIKVAECR